MDYGSSFDLNIFAGQLGITRLADLTGLDRIGYPVVAAIRPASRNLSVHFGKGPTSELARLSAIMEAAELYFSESPPAKLVRSGYSSLPTGTACDPAELNPVLDEQAIREFPFDWIAGFDLHSKSPRLVPWQTTDMDFTIEARKTPRLLGFGATGLAAGFREEHAIMHGLLEACERNAHNTWNQLDDDPRLATLVNPASCANTETASLLLAIEAAGLSTFLWEMTDHSRIPCYLAEICDFADDAATPYAQGAAAYPDPPTAVNKALAEAIQVRLTYIAGGRDDLDWSDYGDRYAKILESRAWLKRTETPKRPVGTSVAAPVSPRDLAYQLEQVGIGPITIVRLSPPDAAVSVVKVIIPSVEDTPDTDVFADQMITQQPELV